MLNFEYCECGCHCHTAQKKGIMYSIYNNLKGNLRLSRGHSFYGVEIGNFTSFKDAVKKAEEDYEKIP